MGRYAALGQEADDTINDLTVETGDLTRRVDQLTADVTARDATINELRARLAGAVQPWQTGDPTFTAPAGRPPIVGVNYHGMWSDMSDTTRPQVLDRIRATGAGWVRLDVAWDSFNPAAATWLWASLDKRVNEIAAKGLKCLVMLHWAPAWAGSRTMVANTGAYAAAAAALAARYKGKVHAIEVWNEPDLKDFWTGTAAQWAALVKAAYPKVKAANPDCLVVSGAPSALKDDWFKALYTGARGSFDRVGVHLYQGVSDAPPTQPGDPKYPTAWNDHLPVILKIAADSGDLARRFWVTETGWSDHATAAGAAVWERGVTAEQQAAYLIDMHSWLAQWPQVEACFWYTDRNTSSSNAHQANFGLLTRPDQGLTLKKSWYGMRCAAGGVCGPP